MNMVKTFSTHSSTEIPIWTCQDTQELQRVVKESEAEIVVFIVRVWREVHQ